MKQASPRGRPAPTAAAGLVLLALLAGLLAGCGRLESIPAPPPYDSAEAFLASRPHAEIVLGGSSLVVMEPSSSALVYGLGLLAVGLGLRFLATRRGERSRLWWGVSLVLWGLGAILAGTSYQAFGYEIKYAGRAAPAWTSWWEILYLLASVASIDAMALAVAHSSLAGKARRRLVFYAALNAGLYALVCLAGAFLPDKFLVSFELMVIFAWPGYLVFLAVNAKRYAKSRSPLDRSYVGVWLGLFAVTAAYYGYLRLGFTEALWARGLWFSANDLLHAGLVAWMLYIGLGVAPKVKDLRE